MVDPKPFLFPSVQLQWLALSCSEFWKCWPSSSSNGNAGHWSTYAARKQPREAPAGSSVNFPISRFMHELVHTRAGSSTNHWHEKHWRSADLSISNLFDDTNSMGKRLRFLIVSARDVYKAVTHWQKS
ncbi:hypothetical protein J1N35_031019 [Gossypium stocksii]|uniref:Uncharacterized protein n=1 Tax=Gossypium stocksii TaxID=47602 RepID=A0A9D3V111_9ROSI|nr:hypothetical protein J1N35_031019 [Gossypium stocksii]